MGYSSKRARWELLVSAENRKLKLQLTKAQQNWTTEDWGGKIPDGLRFLTFCWEVSVDSSVDPSCLLSVVLAWWWCKDEGGVFLTHFGSLSTSWALLKHHSMSTWTKVNEECFKWLIYSKTQRIRVVLKTKGGPSARCASGSCKWECKLILMQIRHLWTIN